MSKKGTIVRKIRWLTQSLILSSTLNVVFLGIFFYFLVRENPYPLPFEYSPTKTVVENGILPVSLVASFYKVSSEELRLKLEDKHLVQDGYQVRDFALGVLATRDRIDVCRALGIKSLSERKWKVGESQGALRLFPGLEDDDFSKISIFLETEKWPQDPQGLFLILKKNGLRNDPTLLKAFCQTSEYQMFELLFSRTGLPLKKGTLLALACEGSWQLLENHLTLQKEGCDFSDKRRQDLLVQYLEKKSHTAAYLLLMTDPMFAAKYLEDRQICLLLDLLNEKTSEAVKFAKEMVISPRSDAVREKAAGKLLGFGIEEPQPVAAKFSSRPGVGELRPVFRDKQPAVPAPNVHVIQPGESLWLIARKYKVNIEELMKVNHLSSSTIRPGKTLKIPVH